MLSDTTGTVPDRNVSPKSCIRRNSWSMPLMKPALTAGTLSENWSALRSRTGPRSLPSAWVGVYALAPLGAKLVTTSMNIVAAVMVRSSIPIE